MSLKNLCILAIKILNKMKELFQKGCLNNHSDQQYGDSYKTIHLFVS